MCIYLPKDSYFLCSYLTNIPKVCIWHFFIPVCVPRTGGSSLRRKGLSHPLCLEWAQTLRQNQVSLSHIYLSVAVWLPAPPQRELSSGLCSKISRYRTARKRGQWAHVRATERLLLNVISRRWARSALRCSLMCGLIYASYAVSVRFTGLEFTKLMTHIKAKNILCVMSVLDCGRIQSGVPYTLCCLFPRR